MTGRDARKLLQAAHENGFDDPARQSTCIPGKSMADAWAICWSSVAKVHPKGKVRPLIASYIERDFVRAAHSRR